MIAYRARHDCGTEVTDDLPDGYPVQEGVGLWCPACRESFWHTGGEPAPEAAPDAEGERFVPPEPPPPELDAPVKRRRWRR